MKAAVGALSSARGRVSRSRAFTSHLAPRSQPIVASATLFWNSRLTEAGSLMVSSYTSSSSIHSASVKVGRASPRRIRASRSSEAAVRREGKGEEPAWGRLREGAKSYAFSFELTGNPGLQGSTGRACRKRGSVPTVGFTTHSAPGADSGTPGVARASGPWAALCDPDGGRTTRADPRAPCCG